MIALGPLPLFPAQCTQRELASVANHRESGGCVESGSGVRLYRSRPRPGVARSGAAPELLPPLGCEPGECEVSENGEGVQGDPPESWQMLAAAGPAPPNGADLEES